MAPTRSDSVTTIGSPRLVAQVVQADGLVLLTDIDGLNDRPPPRIMHVTSRPCGRADLAEVGLVVGTHIDVRWHGDQGAGGADGQRGGYPRGADPADQVLQGVAG